MEKYRIDLYSIYHHGVRHIVHGGILAMQDDEICLEYNGDVICEDNAMVQVIATDDAGNRTLKCADDPNNPLFVLTKEEFELSQFIVDFIDNWLDDDKNELKGWLNP